MKKLFYSMLCIVAVTMFTACKGNNPENVDLSKLDNTVEKCWKTTISYKGYSEDVYVWGTEYVVALSLKISQEQSPINMSWSYKEASAKDEDACEKLNPEYDD